MNKDHAIIILASGLSQRLGQSKQLLTKNNIPLITYMIIRALETQPRSIVIIIPKDQPVIKMAVSELVAQNSIINVVLNQTSASGMAHSLYLGIEALSNPATISDDTGINRVLIMGIDQILLDAEHLRTLLADKHKVVASRYLSLDGNFANDKNKKDIIGLPIVINYKLLKQWQTELSGDKGLRHLIRSLSPDFMSNIINNKLSYDLDTPAQLAYAQQRGWLDK